MNKSTKVWTNVIDFGIRVGSFKKPHKLLPLLRFGMIFSICPSLSNLFLCSWWNPSQSIFLEGQCADLYPTFYQNPDTRRACHRPCLFDLAKLAPPPKSRDVLLSLLKGADPLGQGPCLVEKTSGGNPSEGLVERTYWAKTLGGIKRLSGNSGGPPIKLNRCK